MSALNRSAAATFAATDSLSPFEGGLLERLRLHTRDRHAALDGCFPAGLADRRTYTAYLLAMSGLAAAVCATPCAALPAAWHPWHDTARASAIASDLAHFGRQPRAWPGARLSADAWIGASYVFEGSTLGACVLRRQGAELSAADPAIAPALAFLTLHASGARRWPDFLQRLRDVPAASHPAVIDGATHAFAMTRLLLDEALSE